MLSINTIQNKLYIQNDPKLTVLPLSFAIISLFLIIICRMKGRFIYNDFLYDYKFKELPCSNKTYHQLITLLIFHHYVSGI